MKPEFREKLAHLPFEEKVRKVGVLLQLSRKVKAKRTVDQSASHARSRFAKREMRVDRKTWR